MKRITILLLTFLLTSLWSTASFAFWDDFLATLQKRAVGGMENAHRTRIVGGCRVGDECSTDDQWRTVVALYYRNKGRMHQFCGGNLLHEQWVVTAAHCMFSADGQPLQPADIAVLVDTIHLHKAQEGRDFSVKRLITHPGYDHNATTPYNDIALLELNQPTAQPTMQLYFDEPSEGTDATVVGWGARSPDLENDPDYPNTLHQVSLPMVSRETCNEPDAYNGEIIDTQVCAGYKEGGQDSCVGDSGGPLMIKEDGIWKQVGVVSFGDGCAQANKYGVYTRLAAYAQWMHEESGGLGSFSFGFLALLLIPLWIRYFVNYP